MHANMDYNGQRTNLSIITSDANINSSCQNKHSLSKVENVSSASDSDKVPKQFLQKYLYYMKMSTKPTLTPEAENKIAEQYSRWRIDKAEGMRSRRALPVTARTLETIIRLATAHAKMRLSKSIDIVDALAAIEVMRFVIEAEDINMRSPSTLLGKDDNTNYDTMASKFRTKLQNFMRLKEAVTIEEIEQESHSWFNEKLSRFDIQEMLKKMHEGVMLIDNHIYHI